MAAWIVGLWVGCGGGDAGPAAAPPVPVEFVTVAPSSHASVLRATGAVEALRSVDVRPEASGQVVEVRFSDGATVAAGDALVVLRDADARATLAEATARRELSRLELERAEALRQKEDVSQADLDRARAEYALSEAAVARADEMVRRTVVVAPFGGVTGRREVEVGTVVDPGRRITRVEAMDPLTVDVALPERAVASIRRDQVARVSVGSMGREAEGRVSYISPRVDAGSRTVDVRILLDNGDSSLRPGLSADVSIEVGRAEDALFVPTEAVVPGALGASVWRVADGDVAELVRVETGAREADRVVVTSGLQAGDRVVVVGIARLRPGASIAPTERAP